MADEIGEMHHNKLKKVQEKNKRAQARYRQKQKEKMQNYEGQCHVLNEELDALKQAYSKLEDENKALECTMKEPGPYPAQGAQQRHNGHLGHHEDSSAQAQPAAQSHSGWASVAEHAMYGSLVRELVMKALGEARTKGVDVQPYQRSAPDATIAILQNLSGELRKMLKAADEKQSVEGDQPVVELIHAVRTMGETYQNRNKLPAIQHAAAYLGMRDKISIMFGPARSEHWKAVLDALRLSPLQQTRMLEARMTYVAKMEELIKRRKDIVWELQQTTIIAEMPAKRIDNLSKAMQLADKLQDSLGEEHEAREALQKTVDNQVLTEVQLARAIVTSHPYYPDMTFICELLVVSQDDQQQQQHQHYHNHHHNQQRIASTSLGLDSLAEHSRGPNVPAILQIPAVLDSDANHLTPEALLNAMSIWNACDGKPTLCLPEGSRSLVPPYFQGHNRSQGSQAFSASSSGLQFNGGGRGSGFLPMSRQATAQPGDPF